jgi:pSer/pThr/pTyr-binding forkhead associated (FHA) protein
VIQLTLLSGKMAGTSWVVRRFPVRIGRAVESDLRLEEDGVWDQHAVLEMNPVEGFLLKIQTNALARVNGQPVAEARLRNGDTIELGVVRLEFWLNRVRQTGLRLREGLNWGLVVAVFLAQISILYWLLR